MQKGDRMKQVSRFLIGAVSSGSGKTTLTLGLLRAFRNRGLTVQPFKCGPDYIDTKYHEAASGHPSVNLDSFLSSPDHIESLYRKYGAGKEVCITEGVMGLFDGYDRMAGSSAEIAKWLDIPVVLVVNARSMAYSAAPLLYGFSRFDPGVRIAGVIFNFVSSDSHYDHLVKACEDTGITPLGYLPKSPDIEVPSRHLGLSLERQYQADGFFDRTARLIEQHIDLDRILSVTKQEDDPGEALPEEPISGLLKISVARDEAFNFYYHENIECLKRQGSVTFFSPLRDAALPDSDLVYLPGGYPELFLEALSGNGTMMQSIRQYIESGGKLWAECGGMMYLSESITDSGGTVYPMVGIFPQQSTLQGMKLALGYRRFAYNGLAFAGHEFHYSRTECRQESIVQQYNARGIPVPTRLLRYKNALAGYTHLYWGETGNLLDLFD